MMDRQEATIHVLRKKITELEELNLDISDKHLVYKVQITALKQTVENMKALIMRLKGPIDCGLQRLRDLIAEVSGEVRRTLPGMMAFHTRDALFRIFTQQTQLHPLDPPPLSVSEKTSVSEVSTPSSTHSVESVAPRLTQWVVKRAEQDHEQKDVLLDYIGMTVAGCDALNTLAAENVASAERPCEADAEWLQTYVTLSKHERLAGLTEAVERTGVVIQHTTNTTVCDIQSHIVQSDEKLRITEEKCAISEAKVAEVCSRQEGLQSAASGKEAQIHDLERCISRLEQELREKETPTIVETLPIVVEQLRINTAKVHLGQPLFRTAVRLDMALRRARKQEISHPEHVPGLKQISNAVAQVIETPDVVFQEGNAKQKAGPATKVYCFRCGSGPHRNRGPCPQCMTVLFYGVNIAEEKKMFLMEEYERALRKWVTTARKDKEEKVLPPRQIQPAQPQQPTSEEKALRNFATQPQNLALAESPQNTHRARQYISSAPQRREIPSHRPGAGPCPCYCPCACHPFRKGGQSLPIRTLHNADTFMCAVESIDDGLPELSELWQGQGQGQGQAVPLGRYAGDADVQSLSSTVINADPPYASPVRTGLTASHPTKKRGQAAESRSPGRCQLTESVLGKGTTPFLMNISEAQRHASDGSPKKAISVRPPETPQQRKRRLGRHHKTGGGYPVKLPCSAVGCGKAETWTAAAVQKADAGGGKVLQGLNTDTLSPFGSPEASPTASEVAQKTGITFAEYLHCRLKVYKKQRPQGSLRTMFPSVPSA